MTKIVTALSTSLDGFIAGANDSREQPFGRRRLGAVRLVQQWRHAKQALPGFRLSAVSAELFDGIDDRCGAIVTGRRTYDVSGTWGGTGPLPGVPLFVLTHPSCPGGRCPRGSPT